MIEKCLIRQLCMRRYVICFLCKNHNHKNTHSYFQWKNQWKKTKAGEHHD